MCHLDFISPRSDYIPSPVTTETNVRAQPQDRHNGQNSLLLCVTAPFYREFTNTLWCHTAPESRMEPVPRLEPSSSDYSHPELSDFSNTRSSTSFVLQLCCGQVEVLIQLLFLLDREQSVDIYKLKAGLLYPDDNTRG